jgi:Autotransporter beta-domain
MMIIGNLALQSGASYVSLVGPTGASFANVTGTASLAGTVTAAFAGAPVTKSNLILASSGLSGTFDSFTTVNLPQSLSASISYDSDNVFLNLTSNMAGVRGLTGNQRAIATVLDSNFNNGHLPAAFSAVYGLNGSNLANGLSNLSGESTTGGTQTSFQLMNSFLGVMLDPFVEGRAGPGVVAIGGGALGYAPAGSSLSPAVADAYAAALKAPKLGAAPPPSGWNVWGSAYGGSLNLAANGSAVGAHDVSAGTYGFATGADYHPTPNTVFGFALAGGGSGWSVDGLGGGSSTAAQVGVYGQDAGRPGLSRRRARLHQLLGHDQSRHVHRRSPERRFHSAGFWRPRRNRLSLQSAGERQAGDDLGPLCGNRAADIAHARVQRNRCARQRLCAELPGE